VLLAIAVGLRPAVLVVGSARHSRRPTQNPQSSIHRGLPPRAQVRDAEDAYSTGR
jgi:hypothetical protein